LNCISQWRITASILLSKDRTYLLGRCENILLCNTLDVYVRRLSCAYKKWEKGRGRERERERYIDRETETFFVEGTM
jgi:hypothetical protein